MLIRLLVLSEPKGFGTETNICLENTLSLDISIA